MDLNKCIQIKSPGEEEAFYHFKVLHEDVALRLMAQAAHRVGDAQLDSPFQS